AGSDKVGTSRGDCARLATALRGGLAVGGAAGMIAAGGGSTSVLIAVPPRSDGGPARGGAGGRGCADRRRGYPARASAARGGRRTDGPGRRGRRYGAGGRAAD